MASFLAGDDGIWARQRLNSLAGRGDLSPRISHDNVYDGSARAGTLPFPVLHTRESTRRGVPGMVSNGVKSRGVACRPFAAARRIHRAPVHHFGSALAAPLAPPWPRRVRRVARLRGEEGETREKGGRVSFLSRGTGRGRRRRVAHVRQDVGSCLPAGG